MKDKQIKLWNTNGDELLTLAGPGAPSWESLGGALVEVRKRAFKAHPKQQERPQQDSQKHQHWKIIKTPLKQQKD